MKPVEISNKHFIQSDALDLRRMQYVSTRKNQLLADRLPRFARNDSSPKNPFKINFYNKIDPFSYFC